MRCRAQCTAAPSTAHASDPDARSPQDRVYDLGLGGGRGTREGGLRERSLRSGTSGLGRLIWTLLAGVLWLRGLGVAGDLKPRRGSK